MTEKLGKDESIARVYQFLQGRNNWFQEADSKGRDGGDGILIETEFRSYMLQFKEQINYNWNGEEKYDANDIITQFWKSVDVNTMGQMSGVGASNKNALDKNEKNDIEKNIKITEAINVLLSKVDGYRCPDLLTDKRRWMDSMRASLLNKMSSYTGGVEDQKEIIEYLKTIYQESAVKTNADCIKDQLMNSEFKTIRTQYPEYKYMDDRTLGNIIDQFIKNLTGDETFTEIMDGIKCLMNDYFYVSGVQANSGSIGSSRAFDIPEYDEYGQIKKDEEGNAVASRAASQTTAEDRLNKFGGYDNYGMLNDLQKAVVEKAMNSAIDGALTNDSTYGTYYKNNKVDFKDIIDSYINEKVSSATVDDFDSLKNFDGSTFLSEKASELETVKNNINTLNGKRDALIAKVKPYLSADDEYAQEKKDVITKVFGSDVKDETALQKAVYALSEAELAAKEADFDKEIEKVNKKLPSSFLSSLTDISIGMNQSRYFNLPSEYGTYTTNHLHYSATSDNNLVTITETGSMTVKGGTKGGTYSATIYVKDDNGTVLNQKTIKIVVSNDLDLSEETRTVEGKAINEILRDHLDVVELCGFSRNYKEMQATCKTRISQTINELKNTLISAGYDPARVDYAAKTTINYYCAAIDKVTDQQYGKTGGSSKSITFDYKDANGNPKNSGATSYVQKTYYYESSADGGNKAAEMADSTTGIQLSESYKDTNTYKMYVNLAVVINKFIGFYK